VPPELAIDRAPPLAEVAALFREYAGSLDFALDFQNFDRELATLPGGYAPPRGALLVARAGCAAAGCVALRPIDAETGEVKRLYVRDRFRGQGVGRVLAEEIVATARSAGYLRLRLDTVPAMAAARGLYRRLGFREIEPYTANPVPGALFFELEL
jgi:GNAT superfamily N-acetyltransferase